MKARFPGKVSGLRNIVPAVLIALLASGCGSYRLPDSGLPPPSRNEQPTATEQNRETALPPGQIMVRSGDTLYKIAKREGVSIRGIISANNLKAPFIIYPGQRLRLPHQGFHLVKDGETLYSIAQAHGLSSSAIVKMNNLPPPYRLYQGQKLKLPDKPATQQTVASGDADKTGKTKSTSTARLDKNWRPPPARTIGRPPPRSGKNFLWPVRGRVIVGFGPRKGGLHNDGINIAAPNGTRIRAAENGVIAYSGNQLRGFGNLALIKHQGGWMTAYAHASILFVKRGQTVRRGQVIGRVGRTGSVSNPQLHFELRRNNKPLDPRRYLIRTAALRSAIAIAMSFRLDPQNPE